MPGLGYTSPDGVTKFTNCRLVRDDHLEHGDLWVSSMTGTILSSQATFYDDKSLPDRVVDLGGRLVSPGLIDVQLNGAFGFNFSTLPETIPETYPKRLAEVNRRLVETGVTSYSPTLTSQKPELYRKVLPFLRRRSDWTAADGAESLGAHCEGPFLSPSKNGIHDVNVLRDAASLKDLEDCYGAENLWGLDSNESAAIKYITIAPERGNMMSLIPRLREKGIVCSIGHSEATYEEAVEAVAAGSTMITHLFNAMRPLHHRNPGIFGVLGTTETPCRPYFGVIADGIHLHPAAVKIAFNAHPEGFILVTDAMHLVGLPDGTYPWVNGGKQSRIVKFSPTLRLEGTETIAGGSITLVECVNNFLAWSRESIPRALKAVTATPAAMLGCKEKKGTLAPGSDADLIIFSETSTSDHGAPQLVVDEVWKFGTRVHKREGADIPEPTSPLRHAAS